MRARVVSLAFALLLAASTSPGAADAKPRLVVGSKRFPESYILGEIVRQVAERAGEATVTHEAGLGTTGIVAAALASGGIDVYVEYTGTIRREILGGDGPVTVDALDRELAPRGLGASVPLGFENTYALAMREPRAAAIGVTTITSLVAHPDLRLGLSHEFLERKDGWPALRKAYGLPWAEPRGLEHGLAYEALAAGEVDVIDVYSTDAKIAKYALRVLDDDRRFFPRYDAVLLYRRDLPMRLPTTWRALAGLEGAIPPARMIAMNAEAELDGVPFAEVAARFVAGETHPPPATRAGSFVGRLFGPDLGRLTVTHLFLVFVSLAFGALAGVPLGIVAARKPRLGAALLGGVGIVQTIPSLALLAFLIPVFHRIGTLPTLAALFLYSLLPIVRSTHAGLVEIPPSLHESARALGLPAFARLRLVELPLASRSILAGLKTAAVIDVGTATIAAFVGAGGYGERIAAGLALNDAALLLAGAVPAAALALAVQGAFALLERAVVSPGLRSR